MEARSIPNTAVHCKTKEELTEVLQFIEDSGGKWGTEKKPTMLIDSIWSNQGEDSCIEISDIHCLFYSRKEYYKKEGYTIISAQEYLGEKGTIMKITNLVKKLLDKDTQTLVKAGLINGDLQLTDEGTTELLSILFIEKKDELVKIAQEKLDEEKEK